MIKAAANRYSPQAQEGQAPKTIQVTGQQVGPASCFTEWAEPYAVCRGCWEGLAPPKYFFF